MANENGFDKSCTLLWLHAQTPMHPGSGTALGVVDLPVQRERHTQWPVIPGSALKGILRDACRERAKTKEGYDNDRKKANEEDPELTAVFGPGLVDDSSAFAGALSVTDARIMAFPVRSLRGVFAWVTCPAVIERLSRDAGLAGIRLPWETGFTLGDGEAATAPESPLLVDGAMVFEEFEFKRTRSADEFGAWMADQCASDEFTQQRLKTHMAIIPDDDFSHFVRHATEIAARIGLDYEKKTVKTGALFYEEFIPAETIFYTVMLANSSRGGSVGWKSSDVLNYIRSNLPGVLQVGADETIGKGYCIPKMG